ncbi:MAG TPA: hypothetical protein VM261_39310 [Kofleriaceae bacterium]|nr:hypothetical protein [Kofleriaceae bacterium]
MRGGPLLIACALLPACSFAFVDGPSHEMLTRQAPMTCTTSRTLPLADLVIGAVVGGFVFGATYSAIQDFNEDESCAAGQCTGPVGPALLGGFLMVSPWWISSAVGFSDTSQCRKAMRAQVAP